MPVICASVFLEYLLDLVTLNNMLLIMVNIVYHDVFVDGAVVFDRLVNFLNFLYENIFFVFFIKKLFNEWLW